jgi:hypothetical protein
MNNLEESICYLIGPIEHAHDDGVGWRKYIKNKCKSKNINIKWLDPTDKLEGLKKEIGDEKKEVSGLKKSEKWEELRILMKSIVRQDLRCVDISDFLIIKIDKSIHMCGSYHEIVVALNQKKPVLAIIEGGRKNCPDWIFGIMHYENMFDNEDDLIDYLLELNNGKKDMSDKWILVRKQLKQYGAM